MELFLKRSFKFIFQTPWCMAHQCTSQYLTVLTCKRCVRYVLVSSLTVFHFLLCWLGRTGFCRSVVWGTPVTLWRAGDMWARQSLTMPLNTVKFNVKGIVNMAIILVQFFYQSRIKYPLDFLTSVFKFVNI